MRKTQYDEIKQYIRQQTEKTRRIEVRIIDLERRIQEIEYRLRI